MRASLVRVHSDINGDGDHISDGGQNPRKDRRGKQLCDILVCQHRIDHQNDRGRDQDAKRPARRQGSCRKPTGIPEFAQLWQGYPAHCGCCRQR